MRLFSDLRQLIYPSEFRIALPEWPDSGLAALLDTMGTPDVRTADTSQRTVDVRLLAEVSTGLWRMQQKMVQPGTVRPLEEMRRPFRHLEAVWDTLTQAGVEVREHTGERTPQGGAFALRVLAYQPTAGVTHNTVIETIRPSVYYRQQLVQLGEVIVGIPEKAAEAPGKDTDKEVIQGNEG